MYKFLFLLIEMYKFLFLWVEMYFSKSGREKFLKIRLGCDPINVVW